MPNTITDSQDEQSLDGLFRDSDQIHIPVFQREYVWKAAELKDLLEDLRLIRDDIENIQFLGALVSYERPRPHKVVGRLRSIDIVDGQQRLLTLYMFVLAIAELIVQYDVPLTAQIARDYLLLPHRRGLQVNTRIVPSYPDRTQFALLWDRLSGHEAFLKKLGDDKPSLPAQTGPAKGRLMTQHQRIIRFLQDRIRHTKSTESVELLQEILTIVTERFTFVILELNDAATATKIFERLNFRGQRVGIVDLARNEIFSRVAEEPERAIKLFQDLWIPFLDNFEGRAEHFFFPYSLIHNSNSKKSELFRELRRIWNGKDPKGIISHMEPYHGPFMAVDRGLPFGDLDIHIHLDRLKRLGRPSSVYPFLMMLLHSYAHDEIETRVVVDVLGLVESFLVRRAIVGYEPTGLHAMFKGMWHEVKGDLSITSVSSAIQKRRTIQWPSDVELRNAIRERGVAAARICRYLLVEYDRDLEGDNPEGDVTIEHVMPRSRKPGSKWAGEFTVEEHRKLLDTWANLIPLSKPLNESIQRGEYSDKRKRYVAESMFVTPRWVGNRWEEWTPRVLEERATALADWAVKRWPHAPSEE